MLIQIVHHLTDFVAFRDQEALDSVLKTGINDVMGGKRSDGAIAALDFVFTLRPGLDTL